MHDGPCYNIRPVRDERIPAGLFPDCRRHSGFWRHERIGEKREDHRATPLQVTRSSSNSKLLPMPSWHPAADDTPLYSMRFPSSTTYNCWGRAFCPSRSVPSSRLSVPGNAILSHHFVPPFILLQLSTAIYL